MIKIKINYDGIFIKDFIVSGHAMFDDYGKDIVCASVSSIVITSVNLGLKINEKYIDVKQSEGLINVKILVKDDIINKVFLNMSDMLEELSKDYKKHVKIIKGGGL